MGWCIRDVDEASFWQFNAAMNGFIRANTPENELEMTEEEERRLSASLDAPPVWA